MQLFIKKQIGKTAYTFVVEGENLHQCVMEKEKLSFPDEVPFCGLCKSDLLVLSAHVAQGKFKYTEIRCLKCRGSLTFGQKQEDPNTFYLRRNEDKSFDWQAYKATEK